MSQVDLVVSSPLQRAVETATLVWPDKEAPFQLQILVPAVSAAILEKLEVTCRAIKSLLLASQNEGL